MTTDVREAGVQYRVLVNGVVEWERWVPFKQKKALRAGGFGFVAAAREQERVAAEAKPK